MGRHGRTPTATDVQPAGAVPAGYRAMSLRRRISDARRLRRARAAGFDAAVGLGTTHDSATGDHGGEHRAERVAERGTDPGRRCPSCSRDGVVDVVDVRQKVAYCRCKRCDRSWESAALGRDLSDADAGDSTPHGNADGRASRARRHRGERSPDQRRHLSP